MCLCDSLWVDPDRDSMNGVDFLGALLALTALLLIASDRSKLA